MLSTNVKTTGDLMSIALQAEREAIRRYSELAEKMRKGNNESAAALFERMVIEEQEHERLLLEWMEQENIGENPDIDPIRWRDPNISTTYDDEARDPYYSTPYRALAFAVHNEEIAFRFYTHVAAESENEAVRKYAEVLAREELGHAALLRAERRRAYHAEREAKIAEPRLDPKTIHNEADLLAAAIHIDSYLADEMNKIAADSPEIDSLASETRERININEKALNNQSPPGEDITKSLERIDSYNSTMEENSDNPDSRLQRLCACCDRSFAFYDAIVETTTDEAIMLAAQQLTSSALDRIGVFKQVFGNSYLSDNPNN
jgi:rubrerythrin